MIDIKLKILDDNAIIPQYQSGGASGFDLHSIECAEIPARGARAIKTGLAFEIPRGFEMQIRPRSGLALKHGISVLNTPGTIDSDYRGEIMVIMFNFSDKNFSIKIGDRIAQAVLAQVCVANIALCENLESTNRGSNGFGSTGI